MSDINIGQFSEALNDKMDRDSGNANPAVAKQSDLATLQATVANLQGEISKMLGRIDYTNANKVSFQVQGNVSGFSQTYTVPSDGYIFITKYNEAGGTNTMYINDVAITSPKAEVTMILGNSIPVSKNDVIKCQSSVQTNMNVYGIFFPQKS